MAPCSVIFLLSFIADPCSDLDCGFGARCMIRIAGDGEEDLEDREPFCSCDAICDGDDDDHEKGEDGYQGRPSKAL